MSTYYHSRRMPRAVTRLSHGGLMHVAGPAHDKLAIEHLGTFLRKNFNGHRGFDPPFPQKGLSRMVLVAVGPSDPGGSVSTRAEGDD